MEIIILGSGSSIPRADRAPCSVLVKAAGRNLVLDLGPGILRRLAEEGVDYQRLDALALSHFHPDHSLDVWAWFFALRWPGLSRTEPVRLLTPLGFANLAGPLEQAYGRWVARPDLVELTEVDPAALGSLEPFPGLVLSWAPAAHKPESIAWRVAAEGATLVYTGDTGWSEDVISLARGADFLIADCAAPDNAPLPGHLTPALAGKMAAAAGVRTLILSHLNPELDGLDIKALAEREFGGRVIAAEDGMRLG